MRGRSISARTARAAEESLAVREGCQAVLSGAERFFFFRFGARQRRGVPGLPTLFNLVRYKGLYNFVCYDEISGPG